MTAEKNSKQQDSNEELFTREQVVSRLSQCIAAISCISDGAWDIETTKGILRTQTQLLIDLMQRQFPESGLFEECLTKATNYTSATSSTTTSEVVVGLMQALGVTRLDIGED